LFFLKKNSNSKSLSDFSLFLGFLLNIKNSINSTIVLPSKFPPIGKHNSPAYVLLFQIYSTIIHNNGNIDSEGNEITISKFLPDSNRLFINNGCSVSVPEKVILLSTASILFEQCNMYERFFLFIFL
jgi:hypothetical protein